MADRSIIQYALAGLIIGSEILWSLVYLSESLPAVLTQVAIVIALSTLGYFAVRGQSARARKQGRIGLALLVVVMIAFFVFAVVGGGPGGVILALILGPVRLVQLLAAGGLLFIGRRDGIRLAR